VTTRDDIAAFNERFSSALEHGEFDVIATMYAEDAQFLLAGTPSVRGRGAIVQMMRERHQVSPTVLSVTSGDIWEVDGLVVDVGRIEIAGDPPIQGRELVVYRRTERGELELLLDVPIADPKAAPDT
jgi:ketosteroid isomerase-like protein